MSHPNLRGVTDIFIVEDHQMVRRVLNQLIQRSPDFTVCGEASSAEDALVQIPKCQPQLVLVDVSLPGMNGIELIRLLHEQYPAMWTVALSAHAETVYASQALQAGSRGYITKERPEILMEALRRVRDGDIYVSDKLQSILSDRF